MQKITTFLTFNNQAEEAINFYTSVFKNSKIVSVMKNGNIFSAAHSNSKGSDSLRLMADLLFLFRLASRFL